MAAIVWPRTRVPTNAGISASSMCRAHPMPPMPVISAQSNSTTIFSGTISAVSASSRRQHAADISLQVIRLGDRRMHRMIRRLLQLRQHLHMAIQMARALLHCIEQGRARHVVRTRGGDEDAVLAEDLHRHFIDAAV